MFSIRPRNALISVFDKTGIADLCRCFTRHGISLQATAKTLEYLQSEGIVAEPLSSLTGFSEMLGGRVKSLHPAVFASILALRGSEEHMSQLKSLGIAATDIVVSNLYPFENALMQGEHTEDQMLELIDVGGVALARAAAKNYRNVAVVTDVRQYGKVIEELDSHNGEFTEALLKSLSIQAFERIAGYDASIAAHLRGESDIFGENLFIRARKKMDLRYGENPFQKAAVYRTYDGKTLSILDASVFEGKELSFNNILDLNVALEMARCFPDPSAIIVKHANPAGVAVSRELHTAVESAYEADALSAYGCVIGVNRKVDVRSAQFLSRKFIDALIAPGYEQEAFNILSKKKKMRLLTLEGMDRTAVQDEIDVRHVMGGYLAQTTAVPELSRNALKTVTKRIPTESELESLLFGWKVVRFLWSNAIVLSKGTCTTGIGAGQSSRVDAVKLAVEKGKGASAGSVMASDAFFPFRDGIDEAAKGGVTAVIQPGGSIRDEEVIESANENGMAMLFTGQRLFRH